MSRHTPFYELQTALGEPGCAICALTGRTLERYFAGLVYERVNDTELRAAIRRAYGFCAAHGAMLRAARSALGAAIIQRDVLRAAAAALAAAQPDRPGPGWRAALLGQRRAGPVAEPAGPCPACALADSAAADWVELLARQYDGLRPHFQASPGLCLEHLRAALAHPAGEQAQALRDDQLAIWARLEAELATFIDNHDYQLAREAVGPERDAYARAIALLSGDARVRGSRR